MHCGDKKHDRVWRTLQRAARSLAMAGIAATDEERLVHLAEARRHVDEASVRIEAIESAVTSVQCSCPPVGTCSCPPGVCPHRGRA